MQRLDFDVTLVVRRIVNMRGRPRMTNSSQ